MMHNMSYASYNKHIINGTQVGLEDALKVQEYLLSLDEKELEIKVGTGRTSYIDTGIEIFKLFYNVLEKKESIVFDDGLREGVAINSCLERLHRL
jgi:exopolyphosphatase/guanosine-5'-triphosphate,3'-diphosphate pyrophosphatase